MNFTESIKNELISSGIIDQTLKVGDIIPNFILPNAFSQAVELQKLLVQYGVNKPPIPNQYNSWKGYALSVAMPQALRQAQ